MPAVTGVQLALDLVGIFVFGLSGGLVGVRSRMDVFGVMIMAAVAGLGGGLLRDLLIGDVPPASLVDWRYLLVPALAGVVAFRFHPGLGRIERYISWLDAVGLGLFCVAGAAKAMLFGLPPVAAALMGVLTGVGGGLLRDLLVARTPLVLKQDVYALPALAGSAIVVVAWQLGHYAWWVAIVAAGTCIVLRLLAIHHRWQIWRADQF